MKIALLCHYFAPEPGAPQARLLETGRAWARAGHEVTVLTGFPNHPTGRLRTEDRWRLFRREHREGLEILRSWLYATPNRGFLRKILGHLSFMVTAVLVGGARARRPDVIVVSSPTFFSVLSAWVLSLRWRCPFVFEVRDLWPAIFTELGVLTNRRIIRVLEALEMFLYRRAARVVTVTEGFRRDLLSRGIAAEKVVTITNGVDTARFLPGGDAAEAKRRLGLAGRFTALYIGAHGISHALDRLLDVAKRWRSHPDVLFLFVGTGAAKAALVERAQAEALANVEFRDPVDKESVVDYYRAADVCFVPLRDVPLFTTFIPSKMFEILATETPVIGSVAGEAAEILTRSGGAEVVGPEDVDGIDAALRTLYEDSDLRRRRGRSGAEFVRAHFDRASLAGSYADVLGSVVAESRR